MVWSQVEETSVIHRLANECLRENPEFFRSVVFGDRFVGSQSVPECVVDVRPARPVSEVRFLTPSGEGSALRAYFLVTKRPLRTEAAHPLFRTLLFEEPLSDFVQVVGQYSQAGVALVAVQTFVGTAIKT